MNFDVSFTGFLGATNAIAGTHKTLPLRKFLETPAALPRLMLALSALQLALLIISIPNHRVHLDEAWIGEQAYYLARDGFVRSELFDSFGATGDRIVVYHRLFVAAGGWLVDVLGWSITSLRMVPLVCGAILMAMIWLCTRGRPDRDAARALLALCVFLLVPLDFEYIKVYRPEMMVAMFGMASMLALHADARDARVPFVPLAGVLAGLSMLAHPYGVVYVLAGGATLLIARRWRFAIAFALATALPLLPAAHDVARHWPLFVEQLSNPLVSQKTSVTIVTPLLNLLSEHERLFRNARTIPASTLLILAVIARARRGEVSSDSVVRYTIVLTLISGAVMQDKVDRYGILVFPFFALVIAGFLRDIIAAGRIHRVLRVAGAALATIFVGYGLYYQMSTALAEKQHVARLNAAVARHIPEGSTVAAPMNFIFDEIDRYDIVAIKQAAIECGGELRVDCLVEYMRRRSAEYLVFTRYGAGEESLRGVIDRAQLDRSLIPLARTSEIDVWRLP